MKNTKTTKAVKTATTPANANRKPKVAKLLKVEQSFITLFDEIHKGSDTIRDMLRKWLKDDKQHKHIVAVAEYYKATNEAKMKSFKTQVSQMAKELELELSLQGLGKKQTAKVSKPQPKKGGNTKASDKGKAKAKTQTPTEWFESLNFKQQEKVIAEFQAIHALRKLNANAKTKAKAS